MRRKMTCSTKNLDVFWPRKWPAGENPASYHMTRAAETAKTTEMMKRMKDIEKAELLLLVLVRSTGSPQKPACRRADDGCYRKG